MVRVKFDSYHFYIFNVITMKAVSILNIIFTFIFACWYILHISSQGRISVEEFAPVALLYTLWEVSFAIVALLSIFSKKK